MKPFIYIAALLAVIIAVVYLFSLKKEGAMRAPMKSDAKEQNCQCEATIDSSQFSSANE